MSKYIIEVYDKIAGGAQVSVISVLVPCPWKIVFHAYELRTDVLTRVCTEYIEHLYKLYIDLGKGKVKLKNTLK